MTNKYLTSVSTVNFKPYSTRQEEKRRIIKMCKRKLNVLQNKNSISVKTVLIKNTLKVIEKQRDFGYDPGDSEEDGEQSPSYIESLLNDIDLDRSSRTHPAKCTGSPAPSSAMDPKVPISDVLEEFHNVETFSHNGLVFQEDPHLFLEMSLPDYQLGTSERARAS